MQRSLSERIVDYFRRQGMTLKEVGEHLGVTESFMSRVARGERNLTLDHLERLQEVANKPLPLFLLEACRDEAPEKNREMFDEALALLRHSRQLDKELRRMHQSLEKEMRKDEPRITKVTGTRS